MVQISKIDWKYVKTALFSKTNMSLFVLFFFLPRKASRISSVFFLKLGYYISIALEKKRVRKRTMTHISQIAKAYQTSETKRRESWNLFKLQYSLDKGFLLLLFWEDIWRHYNKHLTIYILL